MTLAGNRALTEFIEDRHLHLNRCGKLVVARGPAELDPLQQLYERGLANGVPLELISAADARRIDPLAQTFERALWSPNTSVADPEQVSQAQVDDAIDAGAQIQVGSELVHIARTPNRLLLTTSADDSIEAAHLVNAAGLYADRIAHRCGVGLPYSIVPFRGLFVQCRGAVDRLRTNIYPVPDPRRPFLGVHWTAGAQPGAWPKIGPTSMPAFGREHYAGWPALHDSLIIGYQLARMMWHDRDGLRRMALSELKHWSRRGLCRAASALVSDQVPVTATTWLRPGLRAQLVHATDASFVQDFVVDGNDRSTHVLNAVSPGWTCALPIAEHVVDCHVMPKLTTATEMRTV